MAEMVKLQDKPQFQSLASSNQFSLLHLKKQMPDKISVSLQNDETSDLTFA